MGNDMTGGMMRLMVRGMLMMAAAAPLVGLSQDAVPQASPDGAPPVQTMPPRIYTIDDQGHVIKADFPELPQLPHVYSIQDALESVPDYLQRLESVPDYLLELEENLRWQELENFDNLDALRLFQDNLHIEALEQFDHLEQLRHNSLDLELEAFDFELQAYDLQHGLFDDYDSPPDAAFAVARARLVNRAQQAPVAGQEPNPSVLPVPKVPKVPESRVRVRSSMTVIAPGATSTSTRETYQAAYSLILDENWPEATVALEAFIQNNYKNRYTDDATFWFAYSMEKTNGATEKVFDAYYAFVSLYPSSSWEDDAKANLIRLGTVLVKKDRKNRAKYQPVMAALRKDDDIKVAISALYGLRRIGDESSLKAIIGIYDETANEELRKNVVSTLARFDGDLVVDKLAEIAINDPSDDVRSMALRGLARSSQAKAANVLRQLATSDDDPKVRLSAVNAIGRMSGTVEMTQLTNKALESIARTDVHVKVRTAAVTSLGKIGTVEAQEALVRILSGKR